MSDISLSLNAGFWQQATSASGGGGAVAGAFDYTVVAPKATSLKVQGSSDGGSTFSDIAGSAITGDGSVTQTLSISLERCPFDHVRAVFAGSGAVCLHITRRNRNQPGASIDRTHNKTIVGPALGTA